MSHYLLVGATKGTGQYYANKLCTRDDIMVSIIGRTKGEDKKNLKYYACDLLEEENIQEVLNIIVQMPIDYVVFFQKYRGGYKDTFQGEIKVSIDATKYIIDNIKRYLTQESSIVIIGSIVRQFMCYDQDISYNMSKNALKTIMEYYALNLPKITGTRVNMLSISSCIKPENEEFYNQENMKNIYKVLSPLGRMCNSDDVCDALDFLLSNKSAFINGQEILMDGGISLISHESLLRDNPNIKVNYE